MTNSTHKNEHIKRKFFDYLKGGEGFAQDSVSKFAEAIYQWQVFSENKDFAKFTKDQATAFCNWLEMREAKTKAKHLSVVTRYHYLRRLKKFFKWLSEQSEYFLLWGV